jgi:ubiquinone/menaquinone biosynthesis C-methylase UbiE
MHQSNPSSTSHDEAHARRSIRHGWDEVAVEYTKDRLGIFTRYAGRLLDLLHPSPESTLLDVGCGNGAVALQAAHRMGDDGCVIGSDIARAMLDQGRTIAHQEALEVSFCQMDAERLGYQSASFDYVTCAFSLFQFLDMDQALLEMWRVLKPGGRLSLSNWGPGYFTPIASMQRDIFRRYGLKPLLNNPIVFEPARLQELISRAGFSKVDLMEETDEVWFTTPEEVWMFNMDMGPFPMMLHQQLSSEEQRNLIHEFDRMMGKLMTESGIKSTFHLIYSLAEKGDMG